MPVMDFDFVKYGNICKLRVGTNGRSAYETEWNASHTENEESKNITLVNSFSLNQNYPNPFNPVTTIKYSIPRISRIVIKIYDVLGNEITTLIDEEKPVGTYELNWNADNLTSGVYFYQLKAGDFVETKKMVLMK